MRIYNTCLQRIEFFGVCFLYEFISQKRVLLEACFCPKYMGTIKLIRCKKRNV